MSQYVNPLLNQNGTKHFQNANFIACKTLSLFCNTKDTHLTHPNLESIPVYSPELKKNV